MHITEDTVALYSAGEEQKRTPKYMTNLQGGDIHIREIINFLFEASTNIATKECACRVSRGLSHNSSDSYGCLWVAVTSRKRWQRSAMTCCSMA